MDRERLHRLLSFHMFKQPRESSPWWIWAVIAGLIAVLTLTGCASTETRAIAAARRDFPGCSHVRWSGMWNDEAVIVACGIPAAYLVTPLETKRTR